jgi:hypothetical protein
VAPESDLISIVPSNFSERNTESKANRREVQIMNISLCDTATFSDTRKKTEATLECAVSHVMIDTLFA